MGLIGAGPWARGVHGPAIAAHQGTELVSVWARRPDAAAEIAAEHGAEVAADPDALFAVVDAVAFAVPPDVQADLAVRAAQAGRHVVLEKPIGATLAEAERLVDAVGEAGVASLVLLTRRYAPEITGWLEQAATTGGWATAAVTWFGGGLLGGPYSGSPWRHERGGVMDVGPHALDLLDAGLGPIVDVLAASHSEPDVWHLLLAHEGDRTSTASLSMALPLNPGHVDVSLYGEAGRSTMPAPTTPAPDCYAHLLDQLLELVHSGRTDHPLDVRRGLHLQRLIDRAERLALA